MCRKPPTSPCITAVSCLPAGHQPTPDGARQGGRWEEQQCLLWECKRSFALFIDHSWHIKWPVCTSSFCWMDISVKNHSSSAKELPLPKAFCKDLKLIINSTRHFYPLQTHELDCLHLPSDPSLAGNGRTFARTLTTKKYLLCSHLPTHDNKDE